MAASPFTRADQIDTEVGARVRARRRELRMSQTKLADTLGVTFQQVQKYERGTNRISSSSLVLIAEALGCSPSELLGVNERGPKIDWSKFHDNEANAALEAFAAIDSPRIRRSVLELIRTLSDAERGGRRSVGRR
jgi:transcriptional regulator with XRE-family HTH domain